MEIAENKITEKDFIESIKFLFKDDKVFQDYFKKTFPKYYAKAYPETNFDKLQPQIFYQKTPVRIIIKNGFKFYCGIDLVRLFGSKNPSVPCKKYFKNMTKFTIPRPVNFLTQFQALCFIMKQLNFKMLTTDENNEYQSHLFLKSIDAGKYPDILLNYKPATTTQTPVENEVKNEQNKEKCNFQNVDLQKTIALIKKCTQFEQDIKKILNA